MKNKAKNNRRRNKKYRLEEGRKGNEEKDENKTNRISQV